MRSEESMSPLAIAKASLDVLLHVSAGSLLRARAADNVWNEVERFTALQARLATSLVVDSSRIIRGPVAALVLERRSTRPRGGWDIVGTLNELHGKTTICVPGNVAVHDPGTWVISHEANDGITRAFQHGSVPTDGVVKLKRVDKARRKIANALAQERKVVAVQVERMGREELILDDKVDPRLVIVESHNISVSTEGTTLSKGLQGWVARVNGQAVTVQVPTEDGTIIGIVDSVDLTSWEDRR